MAQKSPAATVRVGRSNGPALATMPARGSGRGVWAKLAIAALVLAALAATFTYEQDFDAFWHMACGNWMLQHQHVLDHDPFTSEPEDPGAEWVNVYWLFQLTMAALHAIGGWSILTVFQCLLTGAAFALFALSLRKEVPTAWLVLAGLVMLPVFASRIRIRPEMFTLPLLLTAAVLVDGVRRGGPAHKLWWLVPMMLTWVNMHGLYFLGLVVAWGGLAGAYVDKRIGRGKLAGNLPTQAALAPILAATAACLVSPWPLDAALHPLRLWSRISGQAFWYTYGVAEFRPTWENLGSQKEMLVLVGLTALVLLLNARRVPLAHLFWMAPFLVLGLMAVRNVALLAPAWGVPLAWHGGEVLRRIAARKPALARIAPTASAMALLAALAVGGAFATEYAYRVRGLAGRTGAGLCPNYYCSGLAQYLGKLNAPGDVFCPDFGDASAFLYYSYPKRKVWMDGRLEIKSDQRFKDFWDIQKDLRTADGADRAKLPDSVRFFSVTKDDPEHYSALSQSRRFRLIRLDGEGALFVRLDWPDPRPPGQGVGELPDRPNLDEFDLPLGADGLIEGLEASPRHWYRQNPASEYFQLASMFYNLGLMPPGSRPDQATPLQHRCMLLATRYHAAALREGTFPRDVAAGSLARSLQDWARQTGATADATTPIDVDLARALYVQAQLDLARLPEGFRLFFGSLRVQGLTRGRHLDAAAEAADAILRALPPLQQLNPPADYVEMRNRVWKKLEDARAGLLGEDLRALPPLLRAQSLTTPGRGLTLEAIRELKAAPDLDSAGRTALADFLLRLGRPGEARKEYHAAARQGADPAAVELRLALCDWVEGDLYAALDRLGGAPTAAATGPTGAAAAGASSLRDYYKGLLLEELGRYAQAEDALRAASSSAEPELARRIEQAMGRL